MKKWTQGNKDMDGTKISGIYCEMKWDIYVLTEIYVLSFLTLYNFASLPFFLMKLAGGLSIILGFFL